MDLTIPTARLRPEAQLPKYSHANEWGDLAADLYAAEDAVVEPGKTTLVPTGLAMAFPSDYGALVEDRSGLAVKGATTLAGVIDPGYRGEIKVVMTAVGGSPIELKTGDRIAQLRIVRRITATFQEVESLDATVRGEGGFGSTGK